MDISAKVGDTRFEISGIDMFGNPIVRSLVTLGSSQDRNEA